MFWVKKEKENHTVTDTYVEVIGDALKRKGYKVKYEYEWNQITPQKNDYALVITAPNAFRMILKRIKYVFWAQGLWPEESVMRHRSKIRYWLCGVFEKTALKNAKRVFLVSEEMMSYYEDKYKLRLKHKSYIMPCFNVEVHPDSFRNERKYSENTFCYCGGASVWQCFEEMIRLYSIIEKQDSSSKLMLFTKDVDKAKFFVNKYSVQNYEIDFVSPMELNNRLKNVKYGFVLRKDDPVNNVATPTKINTYLANGVIPIYSACLNSVDKLLQETRYKIKVNRLDDTFEIADFMNTEISVDRLQSDYMTIFDKYYNRENHILSICDFLSDLR